MQLPQLLSHAECVKCPLHNQGVGIPMVVGMKTIALPTSLPPGPDVPALLVLGQNPGLQEDRKGEPFIGPSGQVLRGPYLQGVKLHERMSIYLGNGVRCFTVGNETPKAKHYKACFGYSLEDLDAILTVHTNAKVGVLLTGAPVATAFYKHALGFKTMNLAKAFSLNSKPQLYKGREIGVFAVYHPAFCLRKKEVITTVHDHMALVRSWYDGTMPIPTSPEVVEPFMAPPVPMAPLATLGG